MPAASFLLGGLAMAKKGRIVRYTDEALQCKQQQGESLSDWAAAAAMTAADVEAAIAGDSGEAGLVVDWSIVSVEPPPPKAVLNMRVDAEILDFFRNQGKGYQSKINAVLRAYVEQVRG
jgi:uncharacterized protein (DUF4415 family)